MAGTGVAAATGAALEPTIIVMEGSELVGYAYGEEELHQYAEHIGIDLEHEYDLLWIAEAGLKSELPEPWKPCRCEDSDEIFFFNFATGESEWEHPCDQRFRGLVEEHKQTRATRALTLRSAPLRSEASTAEGIVLQALTLAGDLAASVFVAEPSREAFKSAYDKLVASMELSEGVVPKFILPDATLLGFSHFDRPLADVLNGKIQPPPSTADSA